MAASSALFSRFSSPEAVAGRIARRCPVVVWIECRRGAPMADCELDADDAAHGRVLAENWIAHFGAISASVRCVLPNGETRVIEIISEPMPEDFWGEAA